MWLQLLSSWSSLMQGHPHHGLVNMIPPVGAKSSPKISNLGTHDLGWIWAPKRGGPVGR